MSKVLRIRPAGGNVVLCITLSLALVLYGYMTDNSKFTVAFGLVLLCIVVYAFFFWIDFGPDEICVNYLIFRRRISVHRISSIEIARLRNGCNLIICIDGHSPYIPKDDTNSFLQSFIKPWRKRFFCLSFRVITIKFSLFKCEEYIKILTQLYGDVILEQRYAEIREVLGKGRNLRN